MGNCNHLKDRLKAILRDKELYKHLVNCDTAEAQKLLDTLQYLLDTAELDSQLRKDFIVALQRISTHSGLYPACYELDGIRQIGHYPVTAGGFADIYKGKLRSQVVCLKTIRLYEKSQIDGVLKKLSKEAVIWSQLSHPNVLAIYGLFLFQGRVAIVSTWMENGDIHNYLRRKPTAKRRMLALDVANGLVYLHSLGIIHGDLKGPNILVDDGGQALLADFGISTVSNSEIVGWTSQTKDTSMGGTARWQAPELISVEDNEAEGEERTRNTRASDIYAWGCVCLEIFTGKIPFANFPNDYNVIHYVQSGGRPQRPSKSSMPWVSWGLTEEIWSCMDGCWSREPSQRPTAPSVVQLLNMELHEDTRLSPATANLSAADFRRQMSKSSNLVTLDALDAIVQRRGGSEAPIPRPAPPPSRMTLDSVSTPSPPMSPTADADLLQVKDTDFELVRPNFGHLQGTRSSEDSGVMGHDMSVDARLDGSFLRADSPSLSLNAPRSPTAVSDGNSSVWQPLKSSGRGGTDSEVSSASKMDAHRQRELKWMTVLGSVPPAQSRKSKKVKKLIFDGVPESMRYLVWSMLTDGKARCVPGVYAQLGGRGRVAALADVERDVQRCFADQPQLQSTQGPVLSLLQAYLTVVPDVQYVTGLTLITGHLLLLAPEEDAFWIFVSVMDTHIRPYFSSSSMQIDVAGTLFGRAMDSTDPTTAKRLFGDFGIAPSAVCRPWFTSLFVGFLPSDHLNRVWDIFLFEGVPFLFRVAIVLVSCCRRQIFEASSADAALSAVLRPSPEILPTSPEALITLALAVKLKDDDLRKQRVKLEAQIKHQTQAPRTISTPSSISLPRT
ncbi:hypothetical protein DXG01_007021 [Tephrocybe rancida]|nr:hypothetical protein DXG01_007021 [Tephrocybe rancida]